MIRKTFLTLSAFGLALFVLSFNSYAAGDAAKGSASFQTYCVACHGAGGKGDGAAAAALKPKPRDLSNAAYLSSKSDAHLTSVIKNGGAAAGLSPLMPPWGGALSDSDIADVVAFIRKDLCKCEAK